MSNMETFIFLLTMISHLNVVNGISISQNFSTPTLTVIPLSNSIQVSWEKLSSWRSSSIFMVTISIPDSVIKQEFVCEGSPGTLCVLDTEDFGDLLPSCTSVAITVEALGVAAGPQITTTVSPDPLQLSVDANGRNLYINWELPKSCEKSSKLIIISQNVTVHEEVFSVPQSSHTYELSDDISARDVLEVLVKTVNSDGESRGLKKIFLNSDFLGPPPADPPDLTITPHMTSVDVTFLHIAPWSSVTAFTLTIFGGKDNTGDELCSAPFTCDVMLCKISSDAYCDSLPPCTDVFVEVLGINEVSSASSSTLCNTTSTTTTMSTAETTSATKTTSTEASTVTAPITSPISTTPTTTKSTITTTNPTPEVPELILTPYMNSVDVTFVRIAPWNKVTDYTLIIHKGIDSIGDKLCSHPFMCDKAICKISSITWCAPLPACTDVFVEVLGYDEGPMSESTKTLCETTPTTTMSTAETTSATQTSFTETTETTSATQTAFTESTTDTGPTTPKPEDDIALIVGLSVGIPLSLIVLGIAAHIIRHTFFGKTAVERESSQL